MGRFLSCCVDIEPHCSCIRNFNEIFVMAFAVLWSISYLFRHYNSGASLQFYMREAGHDSHHLAALAQNDNLPLVSIAAPSS